MLGVMGAMSEEVRLLLGELTDATEAVHAEITVTRGNYKGTEIALAQSGIGKVNATICTQMLIDLYKEENLHQACRNSFQLMDRIIPTALVERTREERRNRS